jgi:hypothetical protein
LRTYDITNGRAYLHFNSDTRISSFKQSNYFCPVIGAITPFKNSDIQLFVFKIRSLCSIIISCSLGFITLICSSFCRRFRITISIAATACLARDIIITTANIILIYFFTCDPPHKLFPRACYSHNIVTSI